MVTTSSIGLCVGKSFALRFFTLRCFHTPSPHRMLRSWMSRYLVSQAPRLSPERSNREMYYLFKVHNDNLDVKRGLRKRDSISGRTWDEIKGTRDWTNIYGLSPGGNQQMPSQVPVEGGSPKVNSIVNSIVGSSVLRL